MMSLRSTTKDLGTSCSRGTGVENGLYRREVKLMVGAVRPHEESFTYDVFHIDVLMLGESSQRIGYNQTVRYC
jgi:hypothetical protein